MGKDYICLACGNHFLVAPSAEKKCSRCGSANVLKLSPASIFGFSGSGGG
ncbi:MAG: hypothetical protein M1508_09005 [Nitrospirae bacterium]|nr:hypothetical protein [Nitrospirota bacterium]